MYDMLSTPLLCLDALARLKHTTRPSNGQRGEESKWREVS